MPSWTYSISQRTLTYPSGYDTAAGYSGNHEGYNNPDRVQDHNIGPIPPGTYDIGPAFTHPLAGPITMRLTAHAGTNLYGRSGFMIHGDTMDHARNPRADNSASEIGRAHV